MPSFVDVLDNTLRLHGMSLKFDNLWEMLWSLFQNIFEHKFVYLFNEKEGVRQHEMYGQINGEEIWDEEMELSKK